MHPYLITLAAGLASALFYNAFVYAGGFGLLLIYLSPFPIILAGLALRWVMGFAAALVGAIAIAAIASPLTGLGFFFAVGVPAGVLGYLALLARPAANDPQARLEWFPIGELVAASAAIAVLVVTIAAMIEGGFAALDQVAGEVFDQFANQAQPQLGAEMPASEADMQELRALFQRMLPLAGAVSLFLSYLASLYVAGRILRARGALLRPWPDIAALRLPFWAALALAAGVLLSLAGGEAGRAGELLSSVFVLAFAVQGLAVLHRITRGVSARVLVLALVYTLLVLVPFVLLGLSLFGLIMQAMKPAPDQTED